MKGVQCYELFGGIALKNHTFSFFIFFIRPIRHSLIILDVDGDDDQRHDMTANRQKTAAPQHEILPRCGSGGGSCQQTATVKYQPAGDALRATKR